MLLTSSSRTICSPSPFFVATVCRTDYPALTDNYTIRKRENEQWSVDDGEMSDVSLDSDALLDGSVPDPVGLPR